MKLLISTIKTENRSTELILNNLYSIVADAPIDARTHSFESSDSDYDIYVYLIREKYDAIYFHIDQFNEVRINHICEMVKQVSSTTIIMVGGLEVSFDTRQYMTDNPYVDYVIRGEGETVFFNYVRGMLTYDSDFDEIEGLAFRKNGEIMVNPFDEAVDVEKLPFVYDKTDVKEGDTVYYETIRGTSDRSIFQQFLPDARVRALPVGRVCTEVRYFLIKNARRVIFLDRWFNFNADRAYRIFEHIIFNDNGKTTFEMDIDADNLDDETIRLLAEARPGLFVFNLDIGTTNSETLAALGRRENIYQLMYNVTKLMNNRNLDVKLKITAGLPLETLSHFANSFNKVYGLGDGNSLEIETARVPRGCHLREDVSKYGYVFTNYAPYDVLANSYMSANEMIKIRCMANITRTYINDNFKLTIPRMLNDTGLKPFDLFFKLADFVYGNELEDKLVKKEDLYRILNRFAVILYEDLDYGSKCQTLKETMIQDLAATMTPGQVERFEKKGWELDD